MISNLIVGPQHEEEWLDVPEADWQVPRKRYTIRTETINTLDIFLWFLSLWAVLLLLLFFAPLPSSAVCKVDQMRTEPDPRKIIQDCPDRLVCYVSVLEMPESDGQCRTTPTQMYGLQCVSSWTTCHSWLTSDCQRKKYICCLVSSVMITWVTVCRYTVSDKVSFFFSSSFLLNYPLWELQVALPV